MRVGCCAPLEQAQRVKEAGFDYLEADAQQVLRAHESSDTWNKTSVATGSLPLPIKAVGGLLPLEMAVVGKSRDMVGLQNYMQRTAKRAQHLGIHCLIFDSPDVWLSLAGADRDTAWEQSVEFLRMAVQVCAHHSVTMVIEPPNDGRTFMPSKIAQARSLCDSVGHNGVGVMVDAQQWHKHRETELSVLELGDRLKHVRVPPLADQQDPAASDGVDLEQFFCLLHKAGYSGPVSIVSTLKISPDWARSIRKAWEQAGATEC